MMGKGWRGGVDGGGEGGMERGYESFVTFELFTI